MTLTKEQFRKLSVFLNFNFTDTTTREFIKLNIGTIADVYKKETYLSVSAKKEINTVLRQYKQEILKGV